MFIVSIYGGLGSQMDQYSFYLSLKKHYPEVSFKFDCNNMARPQHNGIELETVFGIDLPKATPFEVAVLSDYYPLTCKCRFIMSKLYALRRMLFGPKESHIRVDHTDSFYEDVFKLSPLKSYLFCCNWGNEKYRIGVEEDINMAFTFPPITEEANLIYLNQIISCNAVSVHVRHGDYAYYGFPMLSLDYYKEASRIINSKIENPTYFVFSDDKQYIKDNFDFLRDYVIVDSNVSDKSYRDMQLMSMCKHNIIANSSFSYWGAKLNQHEEKIVIGSKISVGNNIHPLVDSKWIVI